MTAAEEVLADPGLAPEVHAALLRDHLMGVIRETALNDPRSLQKALGPSEIGDECQRKIAYKVLGVDELNVSDPWPTTVGTAVHAWLADMLAGWERRYPGRYLIEQRVDPGGGAPGSNDVFLRGASAAEDSEDVAMVLDRLTGTVGDWKIKGVAGMKRVRGHAPSQGYRLQAHLYGKGQKRAGHPVRWVSIVSLPKAGTLSEMHVWSEPFREDLADWTLARYEALQVTIGALEVGEDLARLAAIPAKPSALCPWCPFYRFRSTDLGRGCPGDS